MVFTFVLHSVMCCILKKIDNRQYSFVEEAVGGSYYIAYITKDEQRSEFSEIAEEVERINNIKFYDIYRIHKQFKRSFYKIDYILGTWCFYFIPHSYQILCISDWQRKEKLYRFLFFQRLFEWMICFSIMILLNLFIANKSGQSFLYVYFSPFHTLSELMSMDMFLMELFFIPAYVFVLTYPLLFGYQIYELYHFYKNYHYYKQKVKK